MYDELVKRVRQVAEEVCDGYDVDPYHAEQRSFVIEEAADAIESVSKAYQMMAEAYESEVTKPQWVPVTEALPEEREAVVVWEPKFLNSYICALSEGEWYVFGGYGVKVFGVTHWMPLPEPPKEE